MADARTSAIRSIRLLKSFYTDNRVLKYLRQERFLIKEFNLSSFNVVNGSDDSGLSGFDGLSNDAAA